jgi:hypothetical protein
MPDNAIFFKKYSKTLNGKTQNACPYGINAFGAKWKHPKESGFCCLAA